MTKTFTHDDVIRFVYEEMDEEESRELSQALLCDPELEKIYNELITMKAHLDAVEEVPSEKVVQRILNYSNSLNLPSRK
jgi:hypothetical protein